VSVAIFDLDNTLLNGDSDYLWGQYLVEQNAVDVVWYEQQNQRFYDEYKNGSLDIYEFLQFSLSPLAKYSVAQLEAWRLQFIESKICQILLPKAYELVEKHRSEGHILLIITATNRFITEPIAAKYNIPHLLATEPELTTEGYTGRVAGIPCFQEGKVQRLHEWLALTGNSLDGSYFYSDSHNDLPLLEKVTHPVAVDPDEVLAEHAANRGWPLISLR